MRARLDQALVKNGGVTHSAKRSAQRWCRQPHNVTRGKPRAFFHGLSFTVPEADEEERASLERAIKAPRKQQKASATRLAEGGRAIELDADGLPWIAPRPRLAPPPESLPLKQKMVLRLRPGCEW